LRKPPAQLARLSVILGGLACLGFLVAKSLRTVPPNHAGVVWDRSGAGTELKSTLSPGRHIVVPWNLVYLYDLLPQQRQTSCTVLSQDGEPFELAYNVHFQLEPKLVTNLHKRIGPNYADLILLPTLESTFRRAAGQSSRADLPFRADDRVWLQSITESVSAKRGPMGLKVLAIDQ
jgi:regulator of protease activity HflC (stomatin/prohibitin superfamily)